MQFNSINPHGINRYLGTQKQVKQQPQQVEAQQRRPSDVATVYRCDSQPTHYGCGVFRC